MQRAVLASVIVGLLALIAIGAGIHSPGPDGVPTASSGRAQLQELVASALSRGEISQHSAQSMDAAIRGLSDVQAAHMAQSPINLNNYTCNPGDGVRVLGDLLLAAGGLIGLVALLVDGGTNTCIIVPPSIQDQATNATEFGLGEVGNELNLTATSVKNELSALNLTQNALEYEAAAAALTQVGNRSFNPTLDLAQSQIAEQLAQFLGATGVDVQEILTQFDAWYVSQFGSGGQFQGTNVPVEMYPSSLTTGATALPTSPSEFASGLDSLGPVWIGQGTQVAATYNTCPLESSITFKPAPGTGGSSVVWNTPGTGGNGPCMVVGAFPGPTGTYTESNAGIITTGNIFTGNQSVANATGPGQLVQFWGTGQPVYGIGIQAKYEYPIPHLISALPSYLYTLESTAYKTANAYIDFLHANNWYNLSSIPANCVVPTPNEALPPNLNLSDLSVSAILSLYYSYLAGEARFYNVSLSSTNFCSQKTGFQLGTATWLDLAVNATGYVYVPGAKGEALDNPQTWAYHGQLLLMPRISSVTVPVSSVWYPYAGNPMQILVNEPGQSSANDTWLQNVVGNSTDPAGSTSSSTLSGPAGYAIFLQSCTVNGVSTVSCGVATETINSSAANITCPAGQSGCSPTGQNLAGLGGFPNLFGWLGGLFSGILGQILTMLLIAVVVIIVIVLVLTLLVGGVRGALRTGSRKGGGR